MTRTTKTMTIGGYGVVVTVTRSGSRNALCEWCGWVSPHLSAAAATAVRSCPCCGLIRGATGLTTVRVLDDRGEADEADPITRACEECGADAGEPCQPACTATP